MSPVDGLGLQLEHDCLLCTDWKWRVVCEKRLEAVSRRMIILAVVLLLAAQQAHCYIKEKPTWVKTCFLKDENFTTCNRDTVQQIFSTLKDGYPEIGIIPLDPLNVTEVRLLHGDGPVAINATLQKVRVTGFASTVIKSNKVFPDKGYSFTTKLRIPHMRIEGNYNVRGRILLLPLVGKGDCWFEPRNMDAEVIHDIHVTQREGVNFFNLTNLHVKFEIEGLKFRLNNLFDGLKTLEESTNTYLNANWKAASESLKPILSRTIEDILIVILRQLFDNVPANFFIGDAEYQGA